MIMGSTGDVFGSRMKGYENKKTDEQTTRTRCGVSNNKNESKVKRGGERTTYRGD